MMHIRNTCPGVLVTLLASCLAATAADRNFVTFPKIDIHVHIYEDSPAYLELMDEINIIRVLNVSVRGMDKDRFDYHQEAARSLAEKYPDKFSWASTFPLWNVNEPGYVGKTITGLNKDFKNNALAVKVWKDVGLAAVNDHGDHIHFDDPVFDPIIEHIVVHGKPVLGHLAEPIHAWRPLEDGNPLHNYQRENPEWHFYNRAEMPSYERIIAARDARVAKHPEMTFVAFHLGSMSHDVGMIDSRLAIYPNMYVGVAARVQFIMRQPTEKVRDFFIKYQDRILYGTDLSIENWGEDRSAPETAEEKARFKERSRKMYQDQWNYFSTDEMVTYRGHTTRGLNLPTEVLEKFYYKNARKIIPGL